MPCPDVRLLHAYLDGELDAAAALEIEQHLGSCDGCRQRVAQATALRAGLKAADYHRVSPQLRARWLRALPVETAPRVSRWRPSGYWAGAASGALAAGLVVALMLGGPGTQPAPLVDELLASHLRSLLPGHLIDVESSDHHTVKPWFAGHADVSPPVVDFPEQDFRLAGGRVDYVGGSRAAVVVYRHGPHVVNLYAWPASAARLPSGTVDRNGYQLRCWRGATLAFCAISDTAPGELAALTTRLEPLTQTPRE